MELQQAARALWPDCIALTFRLGAPGKEADGHHRLIHGRDGGRLDDTRTIL